MSTDSNAQTLSESARAVLDSQRENLLSAGSVPLKVKPIARFIPLSVPDERKSSNTVEYKTHTLENGSNVFEIVLDAKTPSEFNLNTEDVTLPVLIRGHKSEDATLWIVSDVVVMPDIQKVNLLQRVSKKLDLDQELQDQLPEVGADEGVNLRIDQFSVGDNTYATFFARIFSAQTASTEAPMRSVYLFITREAKKETK